MPLVYADANIFANLERGADENDLRLALKDRSCSLVSSVALIQEFARDRDLARRRQRLRAIARLAKIHLQPATYLEVHETIAELRHHHQNWVRSAGTPAPVKSLLRKWKNWQQSVARHPDDPSLHDLGNLQQEEVDRNNPLHKEFRKAAMSENAILTWWVATNDDSLLAELSFQTPEPARLQDLKEDGPIAEAWRDAFARSQLFGEWRGALFDRDHHLSDLRDFIRPYLHGGRPPSLVALAKFCFLEARLERLPRAAIMGSVALAQRLQRYDGGNLGDLGHCLYLQSVDGFLTSDHYLHDALKRVPLASRRACVCLVKPDHSNLVDALDEIVDAARSQKT